MHYQSVLLLTLLLYFNSSFARNNDYTITHYTTDQGLPQNSIKSINFDKAGYCWLGTEMGLARFDGVNFKAYSSYNIKGLHSDRVCVGGIGLSGNIYIEMDNGQQIAIAVTKSRAPSPELLTAKQMCYSLPNCLAIRLPEKSRQTLGNLIYDVRNNGWYNYWISTPKGCLYLILRNKVYYVHDNYLQLIDSISKPYDRNFAVIKEKLVRFVTGGKIKVWEHGILQPHLRNILGPLVKNREFILHNHNLASGPTGTYLYAGKTIYRIDIERNQLTSEIVLNDIDIKDIYTIYYHSGQQRYYIGTSTSGLYIITANVFHHSKMTESLRSQILTKEGESIVCESYLFHRDGTFEILPISLLIGAYIDTDNILYYGSATELFTLDLKTRQKQKLLNLDSRPTAIIGDEMDKSYIWIGTSLSVGRVYKDAPHIFKQVPGRKEGKAMTELIRTGQDSFLLSTQEGLKWYDWVHNSIFRSILDSLSIHSVYVESPDCIWISTYGQGFFLYSKGKVFKLPYGPFDAMKSVHSFIDDGKGYFWLPTNNGLYKVNKEALLAYAAGKIKEVYYYSFYTSNGLRSNEFNGSSTPHYIWFKDSMLSLTSIKGLVWFYPNNIKIDNPDKHIYVDQMEVNDSTISYPGNGHISLGPDFNNISLTVSSPYFGNKENLQLRYKLAGIGTDWQPVPANGKIQLNRIPSGNYRLMVRKLTGQNINHYDSRVLSITVKPWFYNTWWFYTILFGLFCCSIVVAIKLRTRLLMDRNRKLQHIIEDKTGELKASNLMKENLITMILHDLRSPIRFLQFLSKNTAKNYDTFNEQERKEKLIEINTSVAALNDFTEQFFSWAVSQRENFRTQPAIIDLQLLFDELTDLYGDLVTINNNQLLVAGNDSKVYSDKNILSAIIRNLLDNANKNTKNGTIFLESITTDSGIIISITDTGNGLIDSQIAAFYGVDLQPNDSNPGYGHQLIPDLLKKIDGKLDIESKTGAGTRFQIFLRDKND
jgi:signal transduction histidine kinase